MHVHDHTGHQGDSCCDCCMQPAMESFVDMIRMIEPALFKELRWPRHWFPITYARKDQAKLTDHEKDRFLCAYETLNNNGTLGAFVKIHGETHYQHGSQRFLPWHRIYLILLERALRSVHPDVAIPYWDWTDASEQQVPGWLVSVKPTVSMPSPMSPISVTRAPGPASDLASLASNVPSIMGNSAFAGFTSSLEAVHGGVHVWVGGTMSMIPTAPADPIFWMHHCNLDRLWWKWQQSNAGVNPALSGSGASSPVMDPWSYTEADTRDITSLGYTYA